MNKRQKKKAKKKALKMHDMYLQEVSDIFLEAFRTGVVEGLIDEAYDILRRSNYFIGERGIHAKEILEGCLRLV